MEVDYDPFSKTTGFYSVLREIMTRGDGMNWRFV